MKRLLMISTGLLSGMAFAAATEGAPAAAAPEAPPKPPKVVQNGVTRPAAGTKTARVWEIADEISAAAGRAALREEVMAKAIQCHNKQELEELFDGVELPVH